MKNFSFFETPASKKILIEISDSGYQLKESSETAKDKRPLKLVFTIESKEEEER